MQTPTIVLLLAATAVAHSARPDPLTYAVVDTGQTLSYDARQSIDPPKPGDAFFGQDSNYRGRQPSYRDNGDGTISDLVTGLMWQQDPGEKVTWAKAVAGAAKCRTGGHDDWRLPSIKELYSLILFSGTDPDPQSGDTSQLKPFIDTRYFKFRYGDPAKDERIIDSQFATSTKYVSTTMRGNETMFGVNFADGRIKGYPMKFSPRGRGAKTFHVLYVRGNKAYGINKFIDNKDGTITDRATGLTWMKRDSGFSKAGRNKNGGLDWPEALEWAEKLKLAGHDDWRLPTAKELQTILDYTRSPDTTKSAAIAPVFESTAIENEAGAKDWAQYWTGTTHARGQGGAAAAYVAFGRGSGWMQSPRDPGEPKYLDVHGAGCQRSDPKTGDPDQFPHGRGPQGDVIRIDNLVRCVRGGSTEIEKNPAPKQAAAPRSRRPAQQPDHRLPPPPEGAPPRFQQVDIDQDGKVSMSEFRGPDHHFKEFDKNNDGFLTEEEFPKGPPPGPRP